MFGDATFRQPRVEDCSRSTMLHRGIVSSKSLLDLNLDLDMELAAYSGPQYGDAFARGKPRLPGINDMKPPKGTAPGFVRTASTVDLSPVFPFKGPGARVKKLTRFEAEVAAPRLSTSPTHSLPGLYAPWSKNSLLYRQKNGLLKHSSSLDSFDALLNAPARLLRSNRSSRESSRSSRDQPLLLIDEQAARASTHAHRQSVRRCSTRYDGRHHAARRPATGSRRYRAPRLILRHARRCASPRLSRFRQGSSRAVQRQRMRTRSGRRPSYNRPCAARRGARSI